MMVLGTTIGMGIFCISVFLQRTGVFSDPYASVFAAFPIYFMMAIPFHLILGDTIASYLTRPRRDEGA